VEWGKWVNETKGFGFAGVFGVSRIWIGWLAAGGRRVAGIGHDRRGSRGASRAGLVLQCTVRYPGLPASTVRVKIHAVSLLEFGYFAFLIYKILQTKIYKILQTKIKNHEGW
jgi:hypothetical protein